MILLEWDLHVSHKILGRCTLRRLVTTYQLERKRLNPKSPESWYITEQRNFVQTVDLVRAILIWPFSAFAELPFRVAGWAFCYAVNPIMAILDMVVFRWLWFFTS